MSAFIVPESTAAFKSERVNMLSCLFVSLQMGHKVIEAGAVPTEEFRRKEAKSYVKDNECPWYLQE